MLEKLNKKSAIAIAIVVILGILAVAGTVIFLKDKGSTDAAAVSWIRCRSDGWVF